MGLVRRQVPGQGMLYTQGEQAVRLTILHVYGPLENRVVTFAVHGLGKFHRLTLAADSGSYGIFEGNGVRVSDKYARSHSISALRTGAVTIDYIGAEGCLLDKLENVPRQTLKTLAKY